jgi:hypothetical protein
VAAQKATPKCKIGQVFLKLQFCHLSVFTVNYYEIAWKCKPICEISVNFFSCYCHYLWGNGNLVLLYGLPSSHYAWRHLPYTSTGSRWIHPHPHPNSSGHRMAYSRSNVTPRVRTPLCRMLESMTLLVYWSTPRNDTLGLAPLANSWGSWLKQCSSSNFSIRRGSRDYFSDRPNSRAVAPYFIVLQKFWRRAISIS